MGAFRFERLPEIKGGKNVLEFDSSYDRAISRAFGWEEGSVEIREIENLQDRRIIYEVSARDHRNREDDPPKPLVKRGRLLTLTRLEVRRRMDANIPMSPRR